MCYYCVINASIYVLHGTCVLRMLWTFACVGEEATCWVGVGGGGGCSSAITAELFEQWDHCVIPSGGASVRRPASLRWCKCDRVASPLTQW